MARSPLLLEGRAVQKRKLKNIEKPKVKFFSAEFPMRQRNGLLHFSVFPKTTFTEPTEVWEWEGPPRGPSHPLIVGGWIATRHTFIPTHLGSFSTQVKGLMPTWSKWSVLTQLWGLLTCWQDRYSLIMEHIRAHVLSNTFIPTVLWNNNSCVNI